MFKGDFREAFQFHREEAIFVERMIFERVGSHLRFAQIGFRKCVGVDDQYSVGFQIGQVHLQGGGIHDDEHIDRIAGRKNLIRGKMQLITADAGKGARGSANFSGEVREGGDIVAVKRDGVGELAARNLHTVARVSGKTDHRSVNDFALVLRQRNIGGCSHASVRLLRTEPI